MAIKESVKKMPMQLLMYKSTPSWKPSSIKSINYNFIPQKANSVGLKLYLNNNRYTTTGSSKGCVGQTALVARSVNRRS